MERTKNKLQKHSLQVGGYRHSNGDKFLMLYSTILKLCTEFTYESNKVIEIIMIRCYEHLKTRLAR